MNQDELFEATGDIYLSLIHATWSEELVTQLDQLRSLRPEVLNELITEMAVGESWRERVVAFALGMIEPPVGFGGALLNSLRDARGIAIVPACAALKVLADAGRFDLGTLEDVEGVDRSKFDGDVGWAIDRASGQVTENSPATGPNYGQDFEAHVRVYRYLGEKPA